MAWRLLRVWVGKNQGAIIAAARCDAPPLHTRSHGARIRRRGARLYRAGSPPAGAKKNEREKEKEKSMADRAPSGTPMGKSEAPCFGVTKVSSGARVGASNPGAGPRNCRDNYFAL